MGVHHGPDSSLNLGPGFQHCVPVQGHLDFCAAHADEAQTAGEVEVGVMARQHLASPLESLLCDSLVRYAVFPHDYLPDHLCAEKRDDGGGGGGVVGGE